MLVMFLPCLIITNICLLGLFSPTNAGFDNEDRVSEVINQISGIYSKLCTVGDIGID